MRYTHAEKLEVIHLVETADQPVKRTLAELGIPRSSFYRWYERYRVAGAAGLADQSPGPRRFWNRIPEAVRAQGVELALERPDQSPRQLAWNFTDTEGYFISETSVYRILKGYDLITSPAFDLVKAGEKFENPPKRVNELWQTDFTQFKIGIILLPGRALRLCGRRHDCTASTGSESSSCPEGHYDRFGATCAWGRTRVRALRS
jgi:transposase-like protein